MGYTEEKFGLFDIFEKDYDYLPKHQRKNVAEYDNATLYNDFVVDSILKVFCDKEAIIFYISDHGQDIYYSNDNYCGHGMEANAKSDSIGRDIPFMIYTSSQFKNKFPSIIKKIENSVNNQFNTEDFIYSLLQKKDYEASLKIHKNDTITPFSTESIY